MTKTLEQYFVDWESYNFGFGYGTGEPHTIAALKKFFDTLGTEGSPDGYWYADIERAMTPTVAWFMINILCHADIIEYGTSPRGGWLTPQGKRLRGFIDSKTVDQLVELATAFDSDYHSCSPEFCNCDPNGQKQVGCNNPFWCEDSPSPTTPEG